MKKKSMYVILFVVIFFLLFSLLGFYSAIRPPKIMTNGTPGDLGLEYEDVTLQTEDNVTLKGWFVPQLQNRSNAKTIIFMHGYPANKGNILPFVSFLSNEYNLLLFDFRFLGESGGSYSTAGARETQDLDAAIKYLKNRGIREFGVWGFSLGGAVALMSAPQQPGIKAIVSDSSFARLDLLAPQLYALPIIKYPLAWMTTLWGNMLIGLNAKDVAPATSARNLTIPVLVIHSRSDNVIPFKHALLIQEGLKDNPQAEFWFLDKLVHGQSSPEYQERVLRFFEKSF